MIESKTRAASATDRAKASEHAVLLCRKIAQPLAAVRGILPKLSEQLAGKLILTLASTGTVGTTRAVELLLFPVREGSHCSLDIRSAADGGRKRDYFEGELRLEMLSPTTTRVVLVGRYTTAFQGTGEMHLPDSGAIHRVAEESFGRIFEGLVLALEARSATEVCSA
jgi:hypothetical protein